MSKRVALVFGNGDYKHARTLTNPRNDASLVANALRELDFTLVTDRTTGDPFLVDAGLSQMCSALADFSVSAETAEIACLYYAGHGMQFDGENYLLPVDAEISHIRRSYFVALPLGTIRQSLGRTKFSLIALDACRTSPFLTGMRGSERATMFFTSVNELANQVVFFAALAGTAAEDGNEGENSPFASSFARRIREENEIMEVLRNVEGDVRLATEARQNPSFAGNTGGQAWRFSGGELEPHQSVSLPRPINIKAEWTSIVSKKLTPGMGRQQWFRDLNGGPEMVVIPQGAYVIGGANRKEIFISHEFAISRFPITTAQWLLALSDPDWQTSPLTSPQPPHQNLKSDNEPIADVAWYDAMAFVRWLSKKTGKLYKLPSEAEWEIASRCNTSTPYWWGDKLDSELAYFGQAPAAKLRCVSHYAPNPWGLYQTHGNVWEWVEDDWQKDVSKLPGDGVAFKMTGSKHAVLRGGGMYSLGAELHASYRKYAAKEIFDHDRGFRVVRHQLSK